LDCFVRKRERQTTRLEGGIDLGNFFYFSIRGVARSAESAIIKQIGTDSVQRQSIKTLQPETFLNDEVIHYFYVMLSKRDEELCKQDTSRRRSHFFKSFFKTKLLDEGNKDPIRDGKYDYKNVQNWSKKVPGQDIFKLDKVFFPINQGRVHWVCAVAYMSEKRIQMYDSMGAGGVHYLQSIFQYIKDEHNDKMESPLPDEDQWQIIPTKSGTPLQRNGYDCGVFTCMFADFLSINCPLDYLTQEHITICRERIVLSILNGTAIM
jgi:sentrin-specific protease 1